MQQQIEQRVLELADCLVQTQMMVATAESCTGGMVAQYLTQVAGSSRWFERTFVSYSYEAKYEMLGVRPTTIMAHGAVSQECVEEMALGCLQQSHAQLVVAISGVAGPDGGTPHKPVGSVWIAWAGHHMSLDSQLFHFQGDRQSIREQATLAAIEGMLARVKTKLNSVKR
ncbi:MAG TPA: CinA family protein [Thiotrichales bacterium]|nr:CinA family protein [Thiotrichales bacterium]